MKNFSALLTAIAIILTLTMGCAAPGQTYGEGDGEGGGENETKKLSIVCTIFPQYDWTRQILGDRASGVELTLLLSNTIDLHNYQPSVADIAKISSSDLFIYVGGESDGWVEDALKTAVNEDMIVINLLKTLGDSAKFEDIIEGMQHDHDHDDHDDHDDDHDDHDDDHGDHDDGHDDHDDHDHGDHDDHDHDDHDAHHQDYDEHVWLSLRNAIIFTGAITDALTKLDAAGAEEYRGNMTSYIEKLLLLDSEYESAVNSAPVKTLLFGDRFPFRYLVDDYGISYYAAFPGCSAETEASFATIIFLVEKINELGLKNIVVTETSDKSIANQLKNESKSKDQEIIVLSAMQSVAASDIDSGKTYLSVMEDNLAALKQALK